MTIDRTNGSSSASQLNSTRRTEPTPPTAKAEAPKTPHVPAIEKSAFEGTKPAPLSLSPTLGGSRTEAAQDVAEYQETRREHGDGDETRAAAERLADKMAKRQNDPSYLADVAGALSPVQLSEVYGAATDKDAVIGAIKAGVSLGTIADRTIERAAKAGVAKGTGLDTALSEAGLNETGEAKAATAEVEAAQATLDAAKAKLEAAETKFAETIAAGATLVTDEQKAAAVAAFREENAGLYEDVAKAEDALLSTLQANEERLDEATLTEGYTKLAGTRHAEAAFDWATERARTHGPSEALEDIVSLATPTLAATAAAAGTPPDTFRKQLEEKLAPFLDPAKVAAGVVVKGWDYKQKAEGLKGALESFAALASGTAKADDLEKLGKAWTEKSKLGKALAVAGLAYDLYGVATADSAKERIEKVIAATGDAAGIIGGLAQAGRLGSEVLGVSSATIGTVASRFLPGLGAVTSLASAYGRYSKDGFTVGSTVGIVGDLIAAAGSAVTATGVGALPGEAITAVGAGISMLGDAITAVATDRKSQDEREAVWRAANERLPPDQQISDEVMAYLRGGIFNLQTWTDGGTSNLPNLPPESLQKMIKGDHRYEVAELFEKILKEETEKALPDASTIPSVVLDAPRELMEEIEARAKARFEKEAPAFIDQLG